MRSGNDVSPSNERSKSGVRTKGQVNSQKYSPNEKLYFSSVAPGASGMGKPNAAQLLKYETTNNSAARMLTVGGQHTSSGAFSKKKSKDKNNYDLNLDELRKQIMIGD